MPLQLRLDIHISCSCIGAQTIVAASITKNAVTLPDRLLPFHLVCPHLGIMEAQVRLEITYRQVLCSQLVDENAHSICNFNVWNTNIRLPTRYK